MQQPYIVLSRKYRPSTIAELKGQDVLVTTLQNAFNSGRVAHAFLLSGARGVGKTTTARIIAKALNCTGIDGSGEPTLNPCNQCSNCTAINADTCLDVLEMDAASKTGIDDIREIIDNVKYKPSVARFKVYIIDEVHMLSKSAFNALLKTLEEPPEFVKFIFATTETTKVPITIRSRCQHFALRRLSTQELADHLSFICEQEKVSFTPKSLQLIATAAEGSVRDSLSILDQAINISQGELTEELVLNLLGKGNAETINLLFMALCQGDSAQALSYMNHLYEKGIEFVTIFEDLISLCHFITLLKVTQIKGENPGSLALDFTTQEFNNYLNFAQKVTLNGLIVLWQMLLKANEELKLSVNQRQVSEMAVIKITWANETIFNVKDLQQYFSSIEVSTKNLAEEGSNAANSSSNTPAENLNTQSLNSVANPFSQTNLDNTSAENENPKNEDPKSGQELSPENVTNLFKKHSNFTSS